MREAVDVGGVGDVLLGLEGGQSLRERRAHPGIGVGAQQQPLRWVVHVGDVEARESMWRAVRTRGLKRSSKFETTKSSDLRFRALLTEGASEVELALV